MSILFIVGLPGSGKTHLLQKFKHPRAILIDDISVNIPQNPSTDTSMLYVIADPNACTASPEMIKSRLCGWFGEGHHIAFIAFENDMQQCLKNIQNRNDGRTIGAAHLYMLSRLYKPEVWSGIILPVWRP